ncbi:UPF0481 protein [Acorus calamus]|uniref:UPF0481 protein n=1 Tax=Acorus calamus TaxID=4465 RepID=A0AAV9EUC8_ACOCL|nr:UPF0481 protein [Acorus calamus]
MVLKRTGHDIKLYLDAMRSVEDRARACYEGGAHGMGGEEFAEMLVLDGCFVLELFRGAAVEGFKELGYSRNDPVFAVRGTMHSIQRHMIMLENQLPLFVLDLLLGLQIGDPDQTGVVARLALRFFDPLTPSDEPIKMMKPDDRSSRHNLGSIGAFDPLCDQKVLIQDMD